jgi:hypothetical protein
LTDLDDAEEINRLKDQLRQQEGEISQMRRALEPNHQAHGGEPEDDGYPRPEMFVVPTIYSLFAFADIFALRNATPPARALHGVTRTQSGSFISTLSKRPTPEPSTPGPMDDRAFDDNMTHGREEGGTIAMQEDGPSHTLATPVITTVIPIVDMPNQDKVCRCPNFSV